MNDLLTLGGAVFGVLLVLLATLFVATRLYIHSFWKWMGNARAELQGIQADLDEVKRRVQMGGEAYDPKEELESA